MPRLLPFYLVLISRRAGEAVTLHELGPISNTCADCDLVLSEGLQKRRETALASLSRLVTSKRSNS